MNNNFITKVKVLYQKLHYQITYFFHVRPALKDNADDFARINDYLQLFAQGEEIVWKPKAPGFAGKHFSGKIESISTTIIRISLADTSESVGVDPQEIYKTSRLLPK